MGKRRIEEAREKERKMGGEWCLIFLVLSLFFGDLLSFFLSNMIVIERKIYDVVFL